MARLTCAACGSWLATVDDTSWRLTAKRPDVDVVPVSLDEAESTDVWSDLDVVEARALEWRDKGVYDPLPPPPDPPNNSVTLVCGCGERRRFVRTD